MEDEDSEVYPLANPIRNSHGWCLVSTWAKPEWNLPDTFHENTFSGGMEYAYDKAIEWADDAMERMLVIQEWESDPAYPDAIRNCAARRKKWASYPIAGNRRSKLAWLRRHGYRMVKAQLVAGWT